MAHQKYLESAGTNVSKKTVSNAFNIHAMREMTGILFAGINKFLDGFLRFLHSDSSPSFEKRFLRDRFNSTSSSNINYHLTIKQAEKEDNVHNVCTLSSLSLSLRAQGSNRRTGLHTA